MGKCRDCIFSTVGDFNQPYIAAHKYNSNLFNFVESEEELIAMPVYDYECEHESNWRPSRGNMLVDGDYTCKHFVKKND